MKYWLKGGIIFGTIFFIINLYIFYFSGYLGMLLAVIDIPTIFIYQTIIFNLIIVPFHIKQFDDKLVGLILTTIQWVIIGIIIGWIYGKIKNFHKK